MSDEIIYGTVGITLLSKGVHNVIVMADNHDTLPECQNKINVAEWFGKKMKTSKILLEEVPRQGNKLIELWKESPHTQQLKDLYLQNPDIMPGMDIRPFVIPFSFEVLDEIEESNKDYDMDMFEYLKDIDDFFSLENKFVMANLSNYNVNMLKDTLLGKHFIMIKESFDEYLQSLYVKQLLNKKVRFLYQNHLDKLEMINDILNNIMEWYICAHINLYLNKSIIIHAGLAHTDKVIRWLSSHYGFDIKHQEGINEMRQSRVRSRSGCVNMPRKINVMFGGRTLK